MRGLALSEYLGPTQGKGQPFSENCYEILTFDPGGVTGWSYLAIPKTFQRKSIWECPLEVILRVKVAWFHGQISCNPIDPGAKELRQLCDAWPNAVVIFESFFLRQMAVDLVPVDLIAIVRHHLWMKKRRMHFQQASMAKRLDNKRLKLYNVYTSKGGLEHARDADRHALMIVRRCYTVDFRKRLWPNDFEDN